MKQKFFTNTIQSKFIKSLLYNTPLPLYSSVRKGDYIVLGTCYIYGREIIKCTASGLLGSTASYDKINDYTFGNEYPKYTERFQSRYGYYDTETHEVLGKYLRCYRDYYDIDLMPFYNCVSGEYISNVVITDNGVSQGTNEDYKVLKIPVKFNKKYTIAIDCGSEVYIAPAFITPTNTFVTFSAFANQESSNLTDHLVSKLNRQNSMSFKAPILFNLSNTSDGSTFSIQHTSTTETSVVTIDTAEFLQRYERDLYLLIQLPINNASSVVVLEGDYTNTRCNKVFNVEEITNIDEARLNYLMLSNLSLLQLSDEVRYPFSDRLIEYLLLNAITKEDEIAEDVERVQDDLNMTDYYSSTYGIWTSEIRKICYDKYISSKSYNGSKAANLDINGYVDKNVEGFLVSGGSK